MTRLGVAISWHARFVLPVLAVAVAAPAVSAKAATSSAHLARLLAKKDPGALVGGNTIVATGKNEHVYAVPGRPNFVVALGAGATIHGASTNDELGALAKHVRIIAPKAGHALIEGGPQSTIVVGGRGHDLVVERKPGATIKVMSPDNEIIAMGRHDRVVCGPHVHDETIMLGKTDTVSPSCRGHHDTIKHHTPGTRSSRARAHAAQHPVTGAGTNENPYTAPCDYPQQERCKVDWFAERSLHGFWAHEYVPAYRCPDDHPFLLNLNYAPSGTKLPNGVEVTGDDFVLRGAIGVSITEAALESEPPPGFFPRSIATRTGFPSSSATNWTSGTVSYEIVLHCTNKRSDGW